ncbi:MAG: hypothetical protein CV089_05780 [Nitrospira sp. WS110]|nr:hypothetical protein [Nitrospira sp. WS110]
MTRCCPLKNGETANPLPASETGSFWNHRGSLRPSSVGTSDRVLSSSLLSHQPSEAGAPLSDLAITRPSTLDGQPRLTILLVEYSWSIIIDYSMIMTYVVQYG